MRQQVSEGKNVYIQALTQRNELEDETDFLQVGQTDQRTYYTVGMLDPKPTGWVNFPDESQPDNYFKYASYEFELNLDVMQWSRQTYSVLDFLGDIGGLYDALRIIAAAFVAPLSQFALRVDLMASLFNYSDVHKHTSQIGNETLIEKGRIERRRFLSVNCIGYFYKRKKQRLYRLQLQEADAKLNGHLDLSHLIQRNEFTKAALRVLLNPTQSKIMKKISLQNLLLQRRSTKIGKVWQTGNNYSSWLQQIAH